MAHLNRRVGVASVLLTLALVTACSTSPSQTKGAPFDYGTCPSDPSAVLRPRFQSGLLVAYTGQPVVWRGDKYWWQDAPQAGGRFYAGHLVIALAEQTFGRPDFQGRRLYAFIVNNNRIVKEFGPNLMNRVRIQESVGPLPFDERKWELGKKNEEETRSIAEHVLPGETVENWTELVTLQTVSRVAENLTVETMLEQAEAAARCEVIERKVLASTPSELLVEQTLAKCAPTRDRYAIRKLIRGPRSASDVSYSRTAPFSDADRKKWTDLVNRTVWGRPCGDSAS